MEASFWHERWEAGQIGFHNKEINPLLVNHIDKLELSPSIESGARIFLPLCGKTIDFSYLRNLGYQVVGVELSEIAIIELFQALKLTPNISKVNELTLYQAEGIDVFVGDFFNLNEEILGALIGDIDAVYDRASLVALPLQMRKSYTQHLSKITNTVPQLTVTLEYDQSKMNGPPFSITEKELTEHYDDVYSIDCLERNEIIGGIKGKTEGYESAWILKPLI